MQKERLVWVDSLRGFAILLVVVGHAIQYSGIPLNNPVFECIYSFHMPLFFFISGWVTGYAKKIVTIVDWWSFVKRRFRTLVIPWLVWSIIVEGFFFKESFNLITWQDVVNVIVAPKLWFFRYLFIIGVLWATVAYLVNFFTKKEGRAFSLVNIITALCSMAAFLKTDSDLFLFIGAYFIAAVISKPEWSVKMKSKDCIFVVCILIFTCCSCQWSYYEHSLFNSIIKVMVSLSACIVFSSVFAKLPLSEKQNNRLVEYGKNSLPIYVMHYCFVRGGVGAQLFASNPVVMFATMFLVAVVISEICCFLTKALRTSKVMGFILFGDLLK